MIALGYFKGNIWDGAKVSMGLFIDERADARQREALQTIFGGQAGGWPAQFAQNIGEVRGIEFAPIEFEVAGDLSTWRAAIPGKVEARAEALTGPDDAAWTARADAEPAGFRGRTRRRRDMGRIRDGPRRRVRLQMESQRAVEQAHPVRVARPRLTAARPR